MTFETGDIIILKRPKRGVFDTIWTFIRQFISFFIFNSGLIEAVDKYYHIELGYLADIALSQEPPYCGLRRETAKVRVYRLRNWTGNMSMAFDKYKSETLYMPFDWRKFWGLVLGAIFHTDKFALRWKDDKRDMCAEYVARFYEKIGVPLGVNPDNCLPRDINKYCSEHPELFIMVRDDNIEEV